MLGVVEVMCIVDNNSGRGKGGVGEEKEVGGEDGGEFGGGGKGSIFF